MLPTNPLIIAVDFDGTIVEDAYPKIGKEMIFAFHTLKKLQSQGHRLILWTYRSGRKLDEAVDFCKENGLEFYAVNKNFPEEVFDFAWFKTVSAMQIERHRAFARDIAALYISRWIKENSIGFSELKEVLFSPFTDVQQFILECMSNPRYPESKIDVLQESFTATDLYSFCFDHRDEVRTMGIQIIEQFPFKFGQPDKIMVLSNSSDPKVRETVIRVIWKQCEIRSETPNWKPFEGSVFPQPTSSKKKVRIMHAMPPQGKKRSQISSSINYIGTGTAKTGALNIDSFEAIEDFIRRTLFRLPRGPRSPKLPKISFKGKQTWKNKRTLIKAVRDIAIQNKAFALQIVPILDEFKGSTGEIVRAECITALVQISEAHNLNLFGGEQ